MCVLSAFSFPIQIPMFYVKSRYFYVKVSVISSKWSTFYSGCNLWVCTHYRHPLFPWGGGVVVLCARSVLRETRVGGVEWVNFCWYVWYNLGAIYLLCQYQSKSQCPVPFTGLQGTCYSKSMEHPRVWPCGSDCNPDGNPTFTMQNGFILFRGHD